MSTANAQLFTSGFENWNDTVPADWMGVKTNMSADSVEQVSTNPHSGTYAVRLRNSPNATKRFTTQPLHVDSAQAYEVTYWVRGQGDIRASMFDGRQENSGYSPNTAYITVNSSTWTEQTSTLICDHTNDAGEFILYVRLTTGPDRLVVDDVNIELAIVAPPEERSIYEIQYTTAPDGLSPYDGDAVITGGVVTGVDTIGQDGFFIQNGQGPWTGVYVFTTGNTVAIGDSVTFQATVANFNNKTELTALSSFVNHGPYPVPTPETLTADDAEDEQWEGVLVKVYDIMATNLPDMTNNWEWIANSWQGDIIIDDLMYLYTPVVGNAYTVTGIMDHYQTSYKLCPRQLSDIEIGSGIGEFAGNSVSVFPNPANTTLTLDIPNISGRTEYTLTDAIGRTVARAMINAERSTIDVSNLPSGVYALTLRNGGSMWSTSVAVQR